MTHADGTFYEFEGFRLDPRRRLLSGPDGGLVSLKPKVFDTLLHLVEHSGELVDKAALIEAVWGEVIVEENGLNQHVSMLRHALGEVPGENRFIVTIPGRGYRFVPTVRHQTAEEPAAARREPETGAMSGTDAHGVASSSTRRGYLGAGLLASAVGVLVWFVLAHNQATVQNSSAAAALDVRASPAVVRFRVDVFPALLLSGGLAEEIGVDGALHRPSRPSFALSPDGRYVVYAGSHGRNNTSLYRRPLDQQQATPIPGTEGASQPFFSPDSRSVGFLVATEIKRVPIEGGDPRTIAVSGAQFDPANLTPSWTQNDTILISAKDGIYEVPANGGRVERLTESSPEGSRISLLSDGNHVYPQMLPARRAVLFNIADGTVPSEWDIAVETLDGAERKILIEGGSHPRYLPSGHIVFARSGKLLAVPFDVVRLEVIGAPVVILEDVMHGERGGNNELNLGTAQFSVSNTGSLAYVPGGTYPGTVRSLVWVDRTGTVEPLSLPPAAYLWPRFSPDGHRLSYAIGDFGDVQLWVYDVDLETPRPLTNAGHNAEPVWSPDGSRFVFYRVGAGGGLFTMAADGSEEPQKIADGVIPQPASWSIENVLAFVDEDGIWTLDMDGKAQPQPFLQASPPAHWPDFSPDGKWIAYALIDTGGPDVYVRPYPGGKPEHRISPNGGFSPLWSRDGRELFYLARDEQGTINVMVVDVVTEPAFSRSRPRVLFEAPDIGGIPVRMYDISPTGERFVFTTRPVRREPQPVTGIDIVLNWFEELKERVPMPKEAPASID